jgi:hypothetical protein
VRVGSLASLFRLALMYALTPKADSRTAPTEIEKVRSQ